MSLESVVDLTMLKTISGGSPSMMKVFISSFITSAEPNIADLEKALLSSDWKLMKKAAHTYKPQINYMGIKEITDTIQRLEDYAATETNLDQIPAMVAQIKEVSLKALSELKQHIEQL
jgi:HPt (histidine-containing phosphotransfer) domain-containing protein